MGNERYLQVGFGPKTGSPDAPAPPVDRGGTPSSTKTRTPPRVIISASKRTDIPAFYLHRMLQWMKDGGVWVPNPLYRRKKDGSLNASWVSLEPDRVAAIVWWSKNYAIYERLHEKFAYYPHQYFHFTINSRRRDLAWIEPDVPSVDEALRQVEFLAGLKGPQAVAWRYDPICFWNEGGEPRSSWDPDFFGRMCERLVNIGATTCFVSVADRYRKFESRMRRHFPEKELRDPRPDELAAIIAEMREITRQTETGNDHRVRLFSCSEPLIDPGPRGLVPGRCMIWDGAGGEEIATGEAHDRKMKGREGCGCAFHRDIGDYVDQECGYSCVYCYANPNHRRFAPDKAAGKAPGKPREAL